jgi:hypothetical protein
MVTACVNRFKGYKIVHSAHGTFVCCVWVSKQTAIISLDIIDRMVFYNREEMNLCAVRTGSLNIILLI